MDQPLDHAFTEPIMTVALDLIEDQIPARNVLVHCNVTVAGRGDGVSGEAGWRSVRHGLSECAGRIQGVVSAVPAKPRD